MTPERRPRTGDTLPCGRLDQHEMHLYVAEGMQTPIACPGVAGVPDLPCERTDAHDPHPNAVLVGPEDDAAHVDGHCPGRSATDPPPSVVAKYCGAHGSHAPHGFTPVFSPTTRFECDGQDAREADPAYAAMLREERAPAAVPSPIELWLARHMGDTPSKFEVMQLVANNDARFMAIAREGIQVDKSTVLGVRVQLLCDVLFGENEDPRRLAFEHELGLRYAAQLDRLEGEVRKASLARAGQPPSIILPGNPHPHGPTNGRRRR